MIRPDSEGGYVEPSDYDYLDARCACCGAIRDESDLAPEPGETGLWGSCCRLAVTTTEAQHHGCCGERITMKELTSGEHECARNERGA
jgi:hypothetical protein